MFQAGCFFGAFIGYIFRQLLGRKRGLQASALLFTFGAGVMLAANGDRGLWPIYFGRVVAGMGVGAASNLTPIYVAEIAPPAIRGRLVGVYELGWQIGGLVGFWIPYGVNQNMKPSHSQWLIPFAIQLIPGGLLLAGAFWIKESPRWLLDNGRRDEAIENLEYLRMLHAGEKYIVEEIHAMDTAYEEQVKTISHGFFAPFTALFSQKQLVKRMLLGVSLFAWQNGSGINAINILLSNCL
jgi:MFS family permease